MNVLMCCSDLSFRGGMVSVVKGYLDYPDKGDVDIRFVPTHCEGSRLTLIGTFARAYARILLLAMRGRIDVAHLHVAERGSFIRKAILLRTLRRLGVRTVLHHHGAEFEEYYASASPRHQRFIRGTLALADVNIVLSRHLVPMITSKAPDAKVEVLYNAVNVPEENPYSSSARNILMLGRLGKRKGAYDLLDAIKKLDSRLPEDVKFLLCGDGEVEEVSARAAELGISHRIAHVGWVDGDMKARFLRETMINVLPSYNEGLPMTILETMALGIPNISTRIASIPEVIDDGKTGLLIEPGDVNALAESILSLVTDEPRRLAISAASHDLIRDRFSIDHAFASLTDIYRSL